MKSKKTKLKKPFFITFEGIEGSGKSTQIRLLAEFFKKQKFSVLLTREPGGTEIGNQIREIVLHSKNKKMVSLSELFLYAADRAQHIEEVIRPALKKRQIVLCDRFTDSTIAYQAEGRKISRKMIDRLNEMATSGLKPDLTFLIDCPVSVGLKRAKKRILGQINKEERFEKEKISFHEKVRKGFLKIAKEDRSRMVVIDGMKSPEEIHQEILRQLKNIKSPPLKKGD